MISYKQLNNSGHISNSWRINKQHYHDKKSYNFAEKWGKNCLPDKTSFNDTAKQLRSDMEFLVWILREELVFFKEVPQHTVEDFLQVQHNTRLHCGTLHCATHLTHASLACARAQNMALQYTVCALHLQSELWYVSTDLPVVHTLKLLW
jgi:hypothetical protein